MKLLRILPLIAVLGFVSCSTEREANDRAIIEDGVVVTGAEDEADFIVDGEEVLPEDAALGVGDEHIMVGEGPMFAGDEAPMIMEGEAPMMAPPGGMVLVDEPRNPYHVEVSGPGEYVAEKGDTLMFIAFKIYGDYMMWKDLAKMNPGAKNVKEGDVIRFNPPMRRFVWNPRGLPYLIKRGDTLGRISSEVYQTPRRWREIYDNNRPMIKNPNLIFAGFTLYYIPEEGRGMASF